MWLLKNIIYELKIHIFLKTFTLKKNKTLIKHLIYFWKKWLSTVINKYDELYKK